MSTDDKIARVRDEFTRMTGQWFDVAMQHCESPIEQLFYAVVLCDHFVPDFNGVAFSASPLRREIGKYKTTAIAPHGAGDSWFCVSQATVTARGKEYRVDFAFFVDGHRYVVEIDGHDFHEKTKQQAAMDRSRERALTEAGWTVVRFTGSEVYNDAPGCYMSLFDIWFSRRFGSRKDEIKP